MIRLQALCLGSALLLTACATAPQAPSPAAPVSEAPAQAEPGSATAPLSPGATDVSRPPAPPPTPAPPARPPYLNEREGVALVQRLLPSKASDRKGWAEDIFRAFAALQLPPTVDNFCAAIAVIEQESSFIADPPVPGLGRIVREQLYAKAAAYLLPSAVVDLALLKPSRDGRSYGKRIDTLRTEGEMNALFNEMVAELPDFAKALGNKNPIRTGGPMQVSVAFAEEQLATRPYPYPRRGSVRDEVFTRRGGVYFGIANLLDYPASYPTPLYRFADFNAGRYASRNVAFQAAAGRLAGRALALDGDLLRYRDGKALKETSGTEAALQSIAPRLELNHAAIRRDLLLEKSPAFAQSPLWARVMALADKMAGGRVAREQLPQIRLESPKITRELTTEWFARRVDGRWRQCLLRQP
ncbi:DUF1615 domain-containing protein [Niveibacterium sp. 24ML]|uniref:DUF1615 domain-containing protein n=1 Tax=Niveibacterium sp. 24ML TaxID=2985512 RepID=UPI00226D8ED7|nr:DUF1615 domain-containing protein [Niveibacterium sp. 24ML]MCX9155734.1 DUF1615 domain-containing protein [Niveibacterium sp. 24ML]